MKKIPLAHEEPEILPREHLAAAVQSKQRHSHLPGGDPREEAGAPSPPHSRLFPSHSKFPALTCLSHCC